MTPDSTACPKQEFIPPLDRICNPERAKRFRRAVKTSSHPGVHARQDKESPRRKRVSALKVRSTTAQAEGRAASGSLG